MKEGTEWKRREEEERERERERDQLAKRRVKERWEIREEREEK